MNYRSIRLASAGAIIAAGLVSYAAPGASAPDRRARATEYPLQVIAVQTDPKRPKAGKPFTAMIGIVNQETEDLMQSGTVTCPGRIGHRGVRIAEKLFLDGTGIAGCTWVIPAKSAKKRFIASVEVDSDEGFVTVPLTKVIRK